jgi:hypothetical protein
MPVASLSHVLRHLRTLSEAEAVRDLSDGELLQRFRVHREETAFALLVQRHGPMVLGVCSRLLGDAHAAEDAFQATFLILVRKSRSIRKQGSVASWQYGVARRPVGQLGLCPSECGMIVFSLTHFSFDERNALPKAILRIGFVPFALINGKK